MYDPAAKTCKEWKLPGARGEPYALYVDDADVVWLSDFATNALQRFDPATERFTSIPLAPDANVRQLLGRAGEVWGAESGRDALVWCVGASRRARAAAGRSGPRTRSRRC